MPKGMRSGAPMLAAAAKLPRRTSCPCGGLINYSCVINCVSINVTAGTRLPCSALTAYSMPR